MNKLTQTQSNDNISPFDSIKRFDEQGNECWYGRELMPMLGYKSWERVPKVIEKAMASCQNAGNPIDINFFEETRKTSGRDKQDFKLSRYACYLVAMNGDPRKLQIANAQSYFAVKTHEAEIVIPKQNDRIKELELELKLTKAKQHLLDTRNLICSTMPEVYQQRVLGTNEIKVIEYRDRIIKDKEVIRDGTTLNKTQLCHRYGFLTKSGKPNFKQLNAKLDALNLPSNAWELKVALRENQEFKSEYLEELDNALMNDDRQMWLGE